jgi:hypothetical protein
MGSNSHFSEKCFQNYIADSISKLTKAEIGNTVEFYPKSAAAV